MRVTAKRAWLAGLAVVATGCDPGVPEAAACGSSNVDLPYHPRVVRGTVVAPPGAARAARAEWGNWLIREAWAVELEGERPVAGAEVTAWALRGKEGGEPLTRATTGADGGFCLTLPRGHSVPESGLRLEARVSETRLRRWVRVPGVEVEVGALSEALWRLAVERWRVDVGRAEVGRLVNLETVAATSVGLLEPVEVVEGVEEVVGQLVERLEGDVRVRALVGPRRGAQSLE